MSDPTVLQARLIAEIYDLEAPVFGGLAVYRRNLLAGLEAVLNEVFSVTRLCMGEVRFAEAVRTHLRAHRLLSGDRMAYAERFPETLEPGVFRELAAYERALNTAHHADDAQPAGFTDLLSPDYLVGLHPSAGLLFGLWAIEVWHDEEGQMPLSLVPEDSRPLLIWRNPADEVLRRRLSLPEAAFLGALKAGSSPAAYIAENPDTASDLQGLLAVTVPQGLLCIKETSHD